MKDGFEFFSVKLNLVSTITPTSRILHELAAIRLRLVEVTHENLNIFNLR